MAQDNKNKENSNNKERKVLQDGRNASVNRGLKPEPASLSFDFENRPEGDGKSYGLSDDYVDPMKEIWEKKDSGSDSTAEGSSAGADVIGAIGKSFSDAKDRIKNKIAEQREVAKVARAAAAELKKEEDARKAARLKAEAEARAKAEAEAKAKAEEEARLKAEAEAAERAEAEAAERAEAEKAAAKEAKKKAKEDKEKEADKKAGSSAKNVKAGKAVKKAEKKAAPAKDNNKAGKKDSGKAAAKGNNKKGSGSSAPPKPPKSKKLRWLWAAIKITIALCLIIGISGCAYAAYTITHAPVIHPERIYDTLEVSTHIYNDKGKLIDEVYYSENREIVEYEDLSDNLKNAFIAIEDKTFWEHNGFNFKRIIGAVWNSLTGGGEISGTSTITQQLARNVFLPEEKSVRSIKRKIIEMYYAHEIEEVLSKEEILTAYLNTIYLGYGCYGVDTAAHKYFSSSVGDLTLEECAALAALPQAPGVYALITTEPDEYTTEIKDKDGLYANDISADRRYMVLDLMAGQGFITAEEAEAAKKPLSEFIKPGNDFSNSNSAFKDYLLETVANDLMDQYGLTAEQAEKLIYTKGLNIYSTLDSQAQKVITKEFKNKKSFPASLKKNSKVEAAMVITEVGTGEIKAMVGTRKPNAEKLFNRATSPRQPGSSIKPLAVYAPALQKSYEYQKKGKKFPFKDTGYDSQGKRGWGDYITAISSVRDEKMVVNGKVWPQNFSRTYTGNKTFRTAIQQSINTCAVKILAQIGVEYSMDMVKKFGITTMVDDTSEPYNDVNLAALGLGAMTEGVTPLEMALAYATFPNGGVRNSGICYTKVTDGDGKVLLKGESKETKVMDKGVAFIMTDVLQTVVSDGIAFNAAISGERVGGKTGTTDQTWDIWFDGFTPKYAAALWIGTDDNTELNTTSSTAAALWGKIMGQVKRAKGGTYKSKPDNVILKNGEYFTKGTQPPDPPPKKEDKKDKDKGKTDAKTDAKTDGKKDKKN